MNKTLIGWLDGINNLLAVMLILVSALVGYLTGNQISTDRGIFFGLLGLIGGFVVAAIVCGLLATFIEIHKNLARLVQLNEAREKQD